MTSDTTEKTGIARTGKMPGWVIPAIIIIILIVDQWLKIWVKTHMYLGESIPLTSWFEIKFIENNGMAFGMELWNKLLLTAGRIVAVGFFIWVLTMLHKVSDCRKGFIIALSLITAGAAGNIFDCVFYGEIFNNPMPPEVAQFVPIGDGYSSWFEGRVVDMLYFPLFDFQWPEWMPWVGGTYYEFFAYIFNIADSAITIGVLMLLIFYSDDISKAIIGIKDYYKTRKEMSAKSKLK